MFRPFNTYLFPTAIFLTLTKIKNFRDYFQNIRLLCSQQDNIKYKLFILSWSQLYKSSQNNTYIVRPHFLSNTLMPFFQYRISSNNPPGLIDKNTILGSGFIEGDTYSRWRTYSQVFYFLQRMTWKMAKFSLSILLKNDEKDQPQMN